MARMRSFIVGHCTHPECVVVRGGAFRSREFPARAWLIESAGRRILWDTGYAPHFFTQATGIYRLYAAVTPVHLEDAESLDVQLHGAGIPKESIDTVVLSHFHADHVAGVVDFPQAALLASQDAWDSIEGVTGLKALLRAHIPGLVPEQAMSRAQVLECVPHVVLPEELRPFERGWEIAPDVIGVELPGHARGHIGAFVRTDAGWELLASDAAWDPIAYKSLRGPSALAFLIQDDKKEYFETLRKLQALHQKGIPIHLSHEPRST